MNDIYDLCIIGAGPAGIITALEYTHLNPTKNVALIEYGNKGKAITNSLDESIINKNPINHHNPYECTNKGLGGTSQTWGGRCVMYDKVDFMDRPILNGGCTWGLGILEETQKYLETTSNYFECGRPLFNLNDNKEFQEKRIAQNFKNGIVTDHFLERWSMPTKFGERYVEEIESRSNLTLFEGYEARDFITPDESGYVSSIAIRKVDNQKIKKIKATLFVISAGGQETTRILLRNLQLFKTLSKPPEALGKYYQGHVSGKIASVHFTGDPKETDFSFLRDIDDTFIRRRFQFSNDFLVDQNLLNTAIWLDNPLYHQAKHRSGAMSLMYLAMITPFIGKKLAPPAIAHSITKGEIRDIPKHVRNIFKDFPKSLTKPASLFYKRYFLRRKLPGVFLFSPENKYALHFHSEQVPDSSNYMKLDSDGESLIINYSLSDSDITSVIKLHEVLDTWLRKCGCGKLQYWYKKEDLHEKIRDTSIDGIHQVGTTRIADCPEKGVVDINLKLWGTKNIFVCSSSVFPTSGQANPTFFLGAFAVRLAEHLTQKFKNSVN